MSPMNDLGNKKEPHFCKEKHSPNVDMYLYVVP